VELNRSNPAYIRPIDKEIEEVFDPKLNKAFRHGELHAVDAERIAKTGRSGGSPPLSIRSIKQLEMMFRSAEWAFSTASIARRLRICCWM
jgi:hypothetical protein